MTTAEKREKFSKEMPVLFDEICEKIEQGEYRQVDYACNFEGANLDRHILEYVITLLCDELIALTNEELH